MVDLDRITFERAKNGDEKAFKRLYDHYAPFVWRIVYRTAGGDPASAEEIVQETFVRIHRSLKTFDAASAPGTWIFRIAFNAASSFLARRLRLRETTVPYTDDLFADRREGADAYEKGELVQKILASLSPEDRFLLVAKEIDGLTFEELADICGKTQEALRTKLFRIKKKIRSEMKNEPWIEEAVA